MLPGRRRQAAIRVFPAPTPFVERLFESPIRWSPRLTWIRLPAPGRAKFCCTVRPGQSVAMPKSLTPFARACGVPDPVPAPSVNDQTRFPLARFM